MTALFFLRGGGHAAFIVAMVCRGKTKERRRDKELNGNSSPCVPLPLAAAGRLVSPILDSSAAPTLSVLPRLPLFSSPSSSPRQVAAEVSPFHSLTPDALQPRTRGLRVQRLFVVFARRSGLFTRTLQSRRCSFRPRGGGVGGGARAAGAASHHGGKPVNNTKVVQYLANLYSRGSKMFPLASRWLTC